MKSKGILLSLQKPASGPYHPQINAVHTFTAHFLKIHLNIVYKYIPSDLFPSDFLIITVCAFLISPMHTAYFACLILLYLIIQTVFGEL